jgi:hypothetical protein
MKIILPTSGREWFGLVAFTLKSGILCVWPALLVVYCYFESGLSAWSAWSETHKVMIFANIGYYGACGCLTVMGAVELVWHRRRQAVWDLVFAALALFCTSFFGPLSHMPK